MRGRGIETLRIERTEESKRGRKRESFYFDVLTDRNTGFLFNIRFFVSCFFFPLKKVCLWFLPESNLVLFIADSEIDLALIWPCFGIDPVLIRL